MTHVSRYGADVKTYCCDELGAGRLEVVLFLKYQGGAVGGGRGGGAEERRSFVVVVEGVQDAAGGHGRDRERAQTSHALAGRALGR